MITSRGWKGLQKEASCAFDTNALAVPLVAIVATDTSLALSATDCMGLLGAFTGGELTACIKASLHRRRSNTYQTKQAGLQPTIASDTDYFCYFYHTAVGEPVDGIRFG